jgi:DNA-binding HxlR family transcriptional regulator
MLKQILKELARGRGYSRADLAQRLDISEGMLAQMMEELAHKGYLAPLVTPSACGGCSSGSGCKACPLHTHEQAPASRVWVLTPKGRRMAQG